MAASLLLPTLAFSQSHTEKMAWWNEAKYGMFVHWGPYSLYGGVYNGYRQKKGGCEWIMNRCKIPVMEYRANATRFRPNGFDAEKLVLTAQNAGMKYIVFTTKHHDGFAMFQSDASSFNIVDHTGFGRDVTDELVKACRKHGMKFGFYYSQAQDWCNAGGSTARKEMSEGWDNPDAEYIDNYTKEHHGSWDAIQTSRSFADYFHQVSLPQMTELLSRYPDVSVIFFDTPTSMTAELAAEMRSLVDKYPQVITNDRLERPDYPGDYKTPEGRVPTTEEVEGVYWETCMNIGSSWGYKSWEDKWKDPQTIVSTIVTIAARGGNLLLNVGPDSDGQIPSEATDCLAKVGAWLDRYGEAIYGSVRSGLQPEWGECIRKDYPKETVYYLCPFEWPADGKLVLNTPERCRKAELMTDGSPLKITAGKGSTTILLPEKPSGEMLPVIKLTLKRRLPSEILLTNTEKKQQ